MPRLLDPQRPYLQLHFPSIDGNLPNLEVDADCGDIAIRELVVRKALHEARFPDVAIPNHQDLEEEQQHVRHPGQAF